MQAINGNEILLVAKAKVFPKTIKKEAPKAAPLEVPIKPGSTIGFLNNAWTKIPPTANVAPTKILNTDLGNLISMKIRSFKVVNSFPLKKLENEEKISSSEIFTAPNPMDNKKTTTSNNSSVINKKLSRFVKNIIDELIFE